jgi:hypothetical protein
VVGCRGLVVVESEEGLLILNEEFAQYVRLASRNLSRSFESGKKN